MAVLEYYAFESVRFCNETAAANFRRIASGQQPEIIAAYSGSVRVVKPPPGAKVYFVRCETTRLVKIGFTVGSVKERLSSLQTGSASELFLIAAVMGSEADEKALHRKYDHVRVRGEWFRLTDGEVATEVFRLRKLAIG